MDNYHYTIIDSQEELERLDKPMSRAAIKRHYKHHKSPMISSGQMVSCELCHQLAEDAGLLDRACSTCFSDMCRGCGLLSCACGNMRTTCNPVMCQAGRKRAK